MALRLVSFDGLTLPDLNASFDFSTPMTPSTLIPTMNGAVDFFGNRRRIQHSRQFEVQLQFNVTDFNAVATAIRTLMVKTGRTGWLVRTNRDGTTLSLRNYCRLLGVTFAPKAVQAGVINVISIRFETNDPFWHPVNNNTFGPVAIASGVPFVISIPGEEDVLNAYITVQATANISSLTIQHDKTEAGETVRSWLQFVNTIPSGQPFTMDCGKYAVHVNNVPAASGFILNANHNEQYWLRLPPGNNTLTFTLGSGSGTRTIAISPAYR